ncbi:hypothetical protein L4C39_04700 [Vibrio clamense]|uniref:hypothetical protein n=1 Tax=Vibrio clamense TaxID=2910254 RepID=UPI003D25359F
MNTATNQACLILNKVTCKDITMLSYALQIPAPYMRIEEYSRFSGVPLSTLRKDMENNKLIIRPKEAKNEIPMVNVVAMAEMATREALELLR